MVLRPGQRVAMLPGDGLQVVSGRATLQQAGNWWDAGGAPTPIAVYQMKGAASLAASYVNLINPGTYDAAPGVAPTWDSTNGQIYNGTTQYLITGINQAQNMTVIIRCSNLTTTDGVIFGSRGDPRLYVQNTTTNVFNWGTGYLGGTTGGGVYALANNNAYFNSTSLGTTFGTWSGSSGLTPMSIGGISRAGGVYNIFCAGYVQAIGIWNTDTNHATWVPAVSTAMAAL